jgi:hypothetical protein
MTNVLFPEWRKSDNVILFSKLMENVAELKCLGMRLRKAKKKIIPFTYYSYLYSFSIPEIHKWT